MIPLEELKTMARLKGLSLGHAEKDYLLDVLLFSVSKNTKDEMVFKGGTCLYKFYHLGRFSEDADFTAVKPVDMNRLAERVTADMGQFGVKCRIHKIKEPFNSVLLTLRCEGPLFRGTPLSASSVRLDVNLKSSIDTEPLLKTYASPYLDVPAFSLLVMQEQEILAEKIRAILTRNKARDLYDAWELIKRNADVGGLVDRKLAYYNMTFNRREFEAAVERKAAIWEKELGPLLRQIPPFGEVKTLVLSKASEFGKKHQ